MCRMTVASCSILMGKANTDVDIIYFWYTASLSM